MFQTFLQVLGLKFALIGVFELKVRPCPFCDFQTEDRVSETSVAEQQSSRREEHRGMSERARVER